MPTRLDLLRPLLTAALAASLIAAMPMSDGVAHAQSSVRFMTAGELHLRLSATEVETREAGRHYVLGVVDALMLSRDPQLCLGSGVQASQLVDVVAAALVARPDMHRYNAASFVREAIATAYRCV